jgi:Domain of unknown function (DUF4260)
MKTNSVSFRKEQTMKSIAMNDLLTNPVTLQRLEGLVLFTGSIYAWFALGGSWWLFLLLLLTPDISMLGYLVNARVGARLYNVIHSYPLPAASLALGLWLNIPMLTFAGVLVLAHIGWDRMLGYGLKLGSSFQDTHLGRIGR